MASAVIAKGSATILINPLETEARLVFTPDPEGLAWDAPAVNKLASEHHLSAFSDPKVLDTFLAKAARAKNSDPMEMVFAHGIEPEDGQAETINWEALPVPGDMAPFQKEILEKAGPPAIVVVKIERVKQEKKVVKQGALPFMAGKEETAVSWEKKEIREKVAVNPIVSEVKYADRGTKLGVITPSFPGKPGKSVFGRPVAPQAAKESACLFGNGITREKNDIIAQFSGFVRMGENWVDIIPFGKHFYKINSGADGLTLFLRFEPGNPQFVRPFGKDILAAAVKMGFSESCLVSETELDRALAEAVKTNENLEAFALTRVQEAEAKVGINQDKTLAVLHLRKGLAGAAPLEMKAISQALKDSEYRGFDMEKLKADIQAFMQGKEVELNYILAEGRPSIRGTDKEVEILAAMFPEDEQKEILAHVNDWYSRNTSMGAELDPNTATGFATVKKGTFIARVTDSSEGEEGKDIYGNIIPALPGNDPDIKLLHGLELHGSDIAASKTGLLVLKASEKSFHGQVIDYQDAEVIIRVSPDAMEAEGDLFREEGAGTPLSVENIKKTFSSLGIKKGIDWGEVEKACVQARANGSVSARVLAKGEVPIAIGGTALKWLLSFETNAPDVKTVRIKAGTPIAELSEPFPNGRPGYDVRGNELSVSDATDLSIEFDDSIRGEALEPKGSSNKGKRLIAVRSGELNFANGQQLKIYSTKTISGDATGEHRFSGEIQVDGNVLPGCKILGGSHVKVKGLAEGAFISVGGMAVIDQGFKGNGKGVLQARAGIESAFVERASVIAGGDIKLNRGAVLSSMKTNGKFSIVEENGKLLGGVYQARYGIDAADIGSDKGTRTEISFGQDYILKNEINACEGQIAKLKQDLSQMEEKLQGYLKKKLNIPDNVKTEKIRLVELQKQVGLKLLKMRDKFEEHFDSEIRIRGTVFPGVVIESHNRYYEIKQKRSRVIIYFDRKSGQIKEKPIN